MKPKYIFSRRVGAESSTKVGSERGSQERGSFHIFQTIPFCTFQGAAFFLNVVFLFLCMTLYIYTCFEKEMYVIV